MKLTGGWIVAGLAVANLISYASRNALAPVHDALVEKYALSNQFLGILDAAFIFAHALATPVMGWLGDRVHRTRLLVWAVALASLALALGAIAPSPWLLLATRVIGGMSTAAVVPVANSILGELAMSRGALDGRGKARMLATFSLGLLFGAVAAFGLGTTLPYPWHLVAIGGLGLVVTLLLTTLDVPAFRGDAQHAATRVGSSLTQLIGAMAEVGRNGALRRLVVSATLMAFGAGAYNKWLLQYLLHERGFSNDAARNLLAPRSRSGWWAS
ncbi:MAG: MFS transporter [Myxococcales bacterium]|nr:MFS transporter [Myxococcales bacterium]